MTPGPSIHARRLIVAVALLAAAFLSVRVLYRIALPTGSLVVKGDIATPAPYVSDLKPSGRYVETEVDDAGVARTGIVAEPVYLDLDPPFAFDAVSLAIAYENPERGPVEVAALASAPDQIFDRRILEQPLLDALAWKRVTGGRYALFQRVQRYASVDEFLRTPPPRSSIAMLGADVAFLPPFRIEGYAPSAERREVVVSLRGRHELLTYVKDEPLDLAFVVQDMNRAQGEDPVEIVVRRGDDGGIVSRVEFPDDGNVEGDQRSTPLRTLPIIVPAPKEGFYRISFSADDDVFIRTIVTRQRKLVFEGGIYLGDHVGYSDRIPPISFLVRGAHVEAVTHHPEGLQDLAVGPASLSVAEPHVRVGRALPAGDVLVTSPRRDIVLGVDGVIAFSADELFDPMPFRIAARTIGADMDARGIDYVLAAYEPPVTEDGVTTAVVEYDLRGLDRTQDGAYRIAIILPALADTDHPFRLRSVRAAFTRPPGDMAASFREFFLRSVPVRDRTLEVADPVTLRDNLP